MSLASAAALLLSSCGSGFTYVSTGASNAYFKVPSNWKRYDADAILGKEVKARIETSGGIQWYAAFDSGPNPSPTDFDLNTITSYPVVVSSVQDLDPVTREGVSIGSLENALYPLDRLLTDQKAKIVSRDSSVLLPGGFHGIKLVYQISPAGVLSAAPDSRVVEVSQMALLDPGTTRVFLVSVRCNKACYSANQSLIEEIVSSWSVKEP